MTDAEQCRWYLDMDKAMHEYSQYTPQHDRFCPIHGRRLS